MMRDLPPICKGTRGVMKVSCTACHLGKLYLVCTNLRVYLTALKRIFDEQDCIQFFCNLNSQKNFTCPVGKLRTEFTSPIAQSSSARPSDMIFVAHWDFKWEITLATRSDFLAIFVHGTQSSYLYQRIQCLGCCAEICCATSFQLLISQWFVTSLMKMLPVLLDLSAHETPYNQ